MHALSKDVISITSARARLTELAAEVVASGQPKVLTRNGESYVAMLGVEDLDEYRRLRAADHLRNLHALVRASRDIASGKTMSVVQLRRRVDALVTKALANDPPTSMGERRIKRK